MAYMLVNFFSVLMHQKRAVGCSMRYVVVPRHARRMGAIMATYDGA